MVTMPLPDDLSMQDPSLTETTPSMVVVKPNSNIDYKMVIVTPDPDIDYTMIIDNPNSAAEFTYRGD